MAFRHYRLGTPKKGSGAWWQDGRMAVSKTSAASKANWKPTNGSPSIFRRGSKRRAIKTNRYRRLVCRLPQAARLYSDNNGSPLAPIGEPSWRSFTPTTKNLHVSLAGRLSLILPIGFGLDHPAGLPAARLRG